MSAGSEDGQRTYLDVSLEAFPCHTDGFRVVVPESQSAFRSFQ